MARLLEALLVCILIFCGISNSERVQIPSSCSISLSEGSTTSQALNQLQEKNCLNAASITILSSSSIGTNVNNTNRFSYLEVVNNFGIGISFSYFPSLFLSNFSLSNDQKLSFTNVPSVTLSNSRFILNGEMVVGTFEDFLVENCTFSESSLTIQNTKTLRIHNSSFDSSVVRAVTVSNGNLIVSQSTFTNNQKGAIYVSLGNVTVSDSTFSSNTADNGQAGSIFVTSPQSVSVITGTKFDNSIASEMGGAIVSFGDVFIQGCQFNNSQSAQGGDIWARGIVLKDSRFDNSLGRTLAGNVYSTQNGFVNVSNCQFYKSSGGVIFTNGEGATTYISGSEFDGSYTTQYGSFVYSSRGLVVTKSSFKNGYSTIQGGGFFLNGPHSYFSDSIFTSIGAATYGGVYRTSSFISIRNCKFFDCYAGQSAVLFQDANQHSIVGSLIDSSRSAAAGGAIYSSEGGTIFQTTFRNNTVSNGAGGAISSAKGLNITNCVFERNSASTEGGALDCVGNNYLSNSRFSGNNANTGGAVYFRSASYIKNCVFEDNFSIGDGGAIHNNAGQNSITSIKRSRIQGNVAGNNGGGMFVQVAVVSDSIFTANSAKSGGGIYANVNTQVNNTQFYNNNCTLTASSIWVATNLNLNGYYGGSNGDITVASVNARAWAGDSDLECESFKNNSGTFTPDFIAFNASSNPKQVSSEGGEVVFPTLIDGCQSLDANSSRCIIPPGVGTRRKFGNKCFAPQLISYLPPSLSSFDIEDGILTGDNLGRDPKRIYVELSDSLSTCLVENILENSTRIQLNCPTFSLTDQLILYVGGVSTSIPIYNVARILSTASSTETIYQTVARYFSDPNAESPLILNLANINIVASRNGNSSALLGLSSSTSTAEIPLQISDTLSTFFTFSKSLDEIGSDSTMTFSSKVHGLSLLNSNGEPIHVTSSDKEISIVMKLEQTLNQQELDELDCLYWNSTISKWASDGCRKGKVEASQIECLCNHLTNFTVGKVQNISPPPAKNLVPLIVGVVVGVVGFFIIVIVVAVIVWKFKNKKAEAFLELTSTAGLESEIVLKEKIGNGAYGTVYKAIHCETTTVAVKLQHKDVDDKLKIVREGQIMQKLRHPQIVQFLGMYETKEGRYGVMMEFVSNGNLLDGLRENSFNLMEKLVISTDVAAAMRYLSENDIVHCDLSARNVLITDDKRAKLSDFGMAKEAGKKSPHKEKSAARWSPPEVLKGGDFTFAGDIFSFGVLLWEISSNGIIPFGGTPTEEVIKNVCQGSRLVLPDKYEDWKPLVHQCWEENPSKRPTFQEVSEILNRKLGTKRMEKVKQEEDEGIYLALGPNHK